MLLNSSPITAWPLARFLPELRRPRPMRPVQSFGRVAGDRCYRTMTPTPPPPRPAMRDLAGIVSSRAARRLAAVHCTALTIGLGASTKLCRVLAGLTGASFLKFTHLSARSTLPAHSRAQKFPGPPRGERHRPVVAVRTCPTAARQRPPRSPSRAPSRAPWLAPAPRQLRRPRAASAAPEARF